MLKLLTDEFKNLQIICTGSSSLEINQKVDESLAGRVRIIPVYILTFEEYLNFTNSDLYALYNKYESDTKDEVVHSEIKSRYDDYLLYGGLPRIALENRNEEKINLLNDIYQTYLIKDVRNIIETKNIVGFNKLLKLLSSQISSLISINELSVSSGLKYHLVNEFIYLLEQMYILKPLSPYSTNKRNVISKQNKIYFYDTGIRNIVISDFNSMIVRNDNGSIFENSVFNELNIYKDVLSSVYFYRKTNKTEIDFLIEKNNIINAVEVKYKNYKHPSVPRIFYSASDNFYVNKLCIINKNLNTVFNNIKFVQGYLLKKFALKLYDL
jgi:predicted AAA+ superfamily ATPase